LQIPESYGNCRIPPAFSAFKQCRPHRQATSAAKPRATSSGVEGSGVEGSGADATWDEVHSHQTYIMSPTSFGGDRTASPLLGFPFRFLVRIVPLAQQRPINRPATDMAVTEHLPLELRALGGMTARPAGQIDSAVLASVSRRGHSASLGGFVQSVNETALTPVSARAAPL
jgi:hypothetical protein